MPADQPQQDRTSPGKGWEAIEGAGGRIIGWTKDGEFLPVEQTCPKCGAKGAAFICNERGCPANGGAAYG